RAVPNGNALTPPDLARDAPRTHVAQPVEVDACKALWREADASVLNGRDRRLRKLLHRDPPLQHDQRLDAAPAAFAGSDGMAVRLLPFELTALAGPREDTFARFFLCQPGELTGFRVHPPVQIDDGEFRQAMVATDLEVGRIVPRGHLQRAG